MSSTAPFSTAQRASSLYQTKEWRQARAEHLRLEPFCRTCMAHHVRTVATTVDHEPPHRGDERAFWDRRTYVSLCAMHHNQKTGHEVAARMSRKREPEAHPGMVR